jgi:hypothetical protein
MLCLHGTTVDTSVGANRCAGRLEQAIVNSSCRPVGAARSRRLAIERTIVGTVVPPIHVKICSGLLVSNYHTGNYLRFLFLLEIDVS